MWGAQFAFHICMAFSGDGSDFSQPGHLQITFGSPHGSCHMPESCGSSISALLILVFWSSGLAQPWQLTLTHLGGCWLRFVDGAKEAWLADREGEGGAFRTDTPEV